MKPETVIGMIRERLVRHREFAKASKHEIFNSRHYDAMTREQKYRLKAHWDGFISLSKRIEKDLDVIQEFEAGLTPFKKTETLGDSRKGESHGRTLKEPKEEVEEKSEEEEKKGWQKIAP